MSIGYILLRHGNHIKEYVNLIRDIYIYIFLGRYSIFRKILNSESRNYKLMKYQRCPLKYTCVNHPSCPTVLYLDLLKCVRIALQSIKSLRLNGLIYI